MIPVTQTRFYEPDAPPDKQRGNCLTAVVASLLELPIEAVPNFVQDHVDHGADNDDEWNWWTRMWRFVADHGYQIVYVRAISEQSAIEPPEPGECYTVSGISPRDSRIHHIVIHRDGEMIWDPHPDQTGLVTDDGQWWTLRPIGGA